MGRRGTLDEEAPHARADRPQAPPSGGKAGRWSYGPGGGQGTRHKRGDLPPLEKPLWRDESRCDEATQGAGERERRLKKIVADQAVDIDILKEVSRGNF